MLQRSDQNQEKIKKVKLSTVLTSSPYKLLLEEKENEEKAKEQKKNLGNKFKKTNREKIKKTRALTPKNTNEDTICVVCLESNKEDWIQCSNCQKWVHEACADIPECSDDYICDHCKLF